MFEAFVHFVRDIYGSEQAIPLHQPRFEGNEKKYLLDTIDSTFVSSVGAYVDRFEAEIAAYTGAKYAIATVNGTAALHIALLLAGVSADSEVITQSLSFVATCNAIHYCGAAPVFVDIDRDTLNLSPESLAHFLSQHVEIRQGAAWNKGTGKRISACVPMHTFGHPADMPQILAICDRYHIPVVEDAAEALGSCLGQQSCGTFGLLGVFSFNGNKIITTGGGGMIVTNDADLACRAKHLTTTAKRPHRWAFEHDEIGFNYRMPNLNAALGVAQLERLAEFVSQKRALAARYASWCALNQLNFVNAPKGSHANYWLNALVLKDQAERDVFLEFTHQQGIMTRPIWLPMHHLPMYCHHQVSELQNTDWAAERIVNIPSSVPHAINH